MSIFVPPTRLIPRLGLLAPLMGALAPLAGVLDGLLLAVPKKRTTHAKKRMRMSQKYLKTDASIRRCATCGEWKRSHMYCLPSCKGRRGGGTGLGELA